MLEEVDLILVHRININISSIVGIISCILLLYLIHARTISEMRSYKIVLIQGCVIDLGFAVANFIAAPIILLEGSSAYLIDNNFLSEISQWYRYTVTMIWVFVFTLIVPSSPVQFVYRYFVFCRQTKFTGYHYAGFLLVPLSNAIIYIILVAIWTFPTNEDIYRANSAVGYLFTQNNSIPVVELGLIADSTKTIGLIVLGINFLTVTTSYLTILWSFVELKRSFQQSIKYVKQSTKDAQQMLTKALVCQMLSPIILDMLPLIYIVSSMFFGIADPRLSIVLNLGFSWIPFFNNFTTIYFLRPYRYAIKKLIVRIFCKTLSERNLIDGNYSVSYISKNKSILHGSHINHRNNNYVSYKNRPNNNVLRRDTVP